MHTSTLYSQKSALCTAEAMPTAPKLGLDPLTDIHVNMRLICKRCVPAVLGHSWKYWRAGTDCLATAAVTALQLDQSLVHHIKSVEICQASRRTLMIDALQISSIACCNYEHEVSGCAAPKMAY